MRSAFCPGARRASRVLLAAIALTACGPTDPALQMAVDARLAADPATAPLSVDISVTRGVVRLAADVESREQQRRAIELARGVRGVRDVIDDMRLTDAAVLAAVRKTLAADPLLNRVPIEVDGSGGSIRLISNQTDKEQRARAMEIASKVDGVAHVEDRMR